MSIIHTFVGWVLGILMPGTGKRRADVRPAPEPSSWCHRASCPAVAVRLPAHRSPYGLADPPFDGTDTALVRPYVASRAGAA
ncbi:hypothetical protein ACFXAZ_03500 [Streptomyces sp. NPDC059477]|uniref:hypothetical protein n=1 Tax=Streptomyces sp. NPDC059477 TaxID=3346847 RepID=UPI00368A285E